MAPPGKEKTNRSFAGTMSFKKSFKLGSAGALRKSLGQGRQVPMFFKSSLRSSRSDTTTDTAQGFQYSDSRFHNSYDPLRIVKGIPPLISGLLHVKKGGVKSIGASWETCFLELRGSTVLLYDAEYSDWSGASSNPPVQGLFSVLGCEVKEKVRGEHLLLSRQGYYTNIHLKFPGGAQDYVRWERFLTAAANQNCVSLKDFEVLKAIGKGASGKVFLVRDRRTGEQLALKSIDKAVLFKSRSAFRHAMDERIMLETSVGKPFFIQLKYAFQTYRRIYFVTEFCDGGDLFYYLKTHGGKLTEDQTRRVAAETLLALEFMHKSDVVYRDLKPENVLLDANGHIKLADFGLCKRLDKSRAFTETICGTHTYAAPEMLVRKQYGASIDLWTLGIFIYHVWRGRTPYDAKDVNTVVRNMNHRAVLFPRNATPGIISLITSLLERKPENRLGCGVNGIQEVKLHEFFKDVDFAAVEQRQPHASNLQISMEADPGDMPNFDLSEWSGVEFDEDDVEGDACDDSSLWPILRLGRQDIMDFLLLGYRFDHEYALACRRFQASSV